MTTSVSDGFACAYGLSTVCLPSAFRLLVDGLLVNITAALFSAGNSVIFVLPPMGNLTGYVNITLVSSTPSGANITRVNALYLSAYCWQEGVVCFSSLVSVHSRSSPRFHCVG